MGGGKWCRSSKAYHWELKKKEMETQAEVLKGRSEKQDFLKDQDSRSLVWKIPGPGGRRKHLQVGAHGYNPRS